MRRMSVEQYMKEAIRLAETGMNKGEGGPFGAVVVRDNTIIGRGWNRVLATNDPTAHAEITAIRDACRLTGGYWLEGAEIYVNCEPCPMCLSAIYWARIEKLTYAASRNDAAAIGFNDALIYREVCLPAEERSIIMRQQGREEALKVMQKWQQLAGNPRY